MSVAIAVDPTDPTPPYEQIRRQLAGHIATGTLPAGTRLAPVRRLAADLELATGTVARAYRELEAAGLIVTRRGGGTTVAEQDPSATQAGRRTRLDRLSAEFVRAAGPLVTAEDEALDAVRRAWRAWRED